MSVLPTCADCNTALQDPYGSNCGQQASDLHRPIWWILGEIMDAVFSFDSRTFRTFWLVFGEPGEFTRRYNSGQGAALLAPFRLFERDVLVLLDAAAHGAGACRVRVQGYCDQGFAGGESFAKWTRLGFRTFKRRKDIQPRST